MLRRVVVKNTPTPPLNTAAAAMRWLRMAYLFRIGPGASQA